MDPWFEPYPVPPPGGARPAFATGTCSSVSTPWHATEPGGPGTGLTAQTLLRGRGKRRGIPVFPRKGAMAPYAGKSATSRGVDAPPASARTGPGSCPNTARQPRQPQGADGRSLRRRRGRGRQVTFGTPSRKRRRRFPQPAPQTATPPSAARGSHRIHGFGHTPPPAPRDRTRMTASTPLLVTFAAYLLLMVGLGFVAWRRTRTFDDYILGG